ncbi:MAG: hypothetical protein FWE32_10820 [Oscillospiraceae bacterium]|nr:hypothetical protein [Oscillospiraceae bacterium]
MKDNLRPGIYAQIEISGYHGGGRGGIALLLPGGALSADRFESYGQASEMLSGSPTALRCLDLMFGGGAGSVCLVTAPDMSAALGELSGFGGIKAIVSGFVQLDDLTLLRDFAHQSAEDSRACVAIAGIGNPQAAIHFANTLCSGRMVLSCPAVTPKDGGQAKAIYGACALAAAVACLSNPTQNFNGMDFSTLGEVNKLSEDEIQALLAAGVCVFEGVAGRVELIRGLTTDSPTQAGGGSLRALNTVLIVDYVVGGVRETLRQKLRGRGRATIEGIRDQVAVELADKKDEGVIASFETPRCRVDKGDPGVCLVEISFEVAHLLSQIRLTAFVRV